MAKFLLENGNGKAISSTVSVWTRAQFLLFSCNINFLLLNNRATWDNREKVRKDAKSIFQRPFHRRPRCWIVRSQFRYYIVSRCQLELIPAQHDNAAIAQSCSIHVYCVLSSVQTDASYSSVLFLSCLTLPRHSSTIMMNRILIFSCEYPSNSS